MGSGGAHCARVPPCMGVPAGLEGLGHAQGSQWGSKREAGPDFPNGDRLRGALEVACSQVNSWRSLCCGVT